MHSLPTAAYRPLTRSPAHASWARRHFDSRTAMIETQVHDDILEILLAGESLSALSRVLFMSRECKAVCRVHVRHAVRLWQHVDRGIHGSKIYAGRRAISRRSACIFRGRAA